MVERPTLDAVIFDAGGTLVRLDFEWMSTMLASLGAEVPAAALRNGEVEGRRRFDASYDAPRPADGPLPALGRRGDVRAYYAGLLAGGGCPEPRLAAAVERLVERQAGPGLWTRPAEGARAVLDELGAAGMPMACISNSDGRAEQHLTDCGVRAGLAFVVDSTIEKVEKPDPAIFRIALSRLGVAADRALYVGDIRSVDPPGARAAGMHSVLLDPWGDYADGEPSIPTIAALPGWIRARFPIPVHGRPS
jgi:putative hydrolase of the HAD superfamily